MASLSLIEVFCFSFGALSSSSEAAAAAAAAAGSVFPSCQILILFLCCWDGQRWIFLAFEDDETVVLDDDENGGNSKNKNKKRLFLC